MDAFVDFVVSQIYADARCDPGRATPTPELVRALVGPHAIHILSRKHGVKNCAASDTANGQFVIHVPSSFAPWKVNHSVSRQLVKWYLTRHAYDGARVESIVRRIAAAVCVPAPAFARARMQFNEDIPELSRHFRVSQSLMALRLAECTGYPTALRTAKQIIVRGNHWDWPDTDAEWVLLFRRARAIGLVVQHLNDVRGRVVIRAR